jgi:hypothetical protein
LLRANDIKEKAHSVSLSTREKVLLCLAEGDEAPKRPAQLLKLALAVGFSKAKTWNISRELGKLEGLAIRTPAGWELTSIGRQQAVALVSMSGPTPVVSAASSSLKAHATTLKSSHVKNFLLEAITCVDAGSMRAAVVLSWVGAVAILQDVVIGHNLAAFNTEAQRRDSKWKPAKVSDDLSRMKEADFLLVLEAIALLGKNVRQELEGCLRLRNSCGHPNTLIVGENKVAAHLETLIQNVFAKF